MSPPNNTKREAPLIRISLGFFYRLGGTLDKLRTLTADTTVLDAFPLLNDAKNELEGMFGAQWFSPAVRSAYPPGQALLNAINPLLTITDFNSKLGHLEVFGLQTALAEFDTVTRSELAVTDAYFVTRKAGYDTFSLISNAERCFPGDLISKVPKALPDIRDAGRCLAFELSTASGFHVFRALETVLGAYWTATSGGKAQPRPKTMGVYLKQMDKYGYGHAKTKSVLRQIKDLHRNPLIHPHESLTLDEAVSLFGICHSAIEAMLKEIPTPTLPAVP